MGCCLYQFRLYDQSFDYLQQEFCQVRNLRLETFNSLVYVGFIVEENAS